jgi:hypothetical protein
MDPEHANTIPISEILGKLDLRPLRQEGAVVYYPSLWDRKRQAVLLVATQTNRWSDATIKNGTLMEFVVRYLQSHGEAHTEVDALRWLRNMSVSLPHLPVSQADQHPKLELRHKKVIHYPGLVHYLNREGIALALAQQYLKEIHARNRQTGNNFIALGLPTVDGGYALRTAYLERFIGEPSLSFIRGRVPKPNGIHLFKDVLDYLCILSYRNKTALDEDVIILNGWGYLSQLPAYIRQYGYQTLYSWLDTTEQGQQATKFVNLFLQTETGLRHQPMNSVYAAHGHVQAWYRHQRRQID